MGLPYLGLDKLDLIFCTAKACKVLVYKGSDYLKSAKDIMDGTMDSSSGIVATKNHYDWLVNSGNEFRPGRVTLFSKAINPMCHTKTVCEVIDPLKELKIPPLPGKNRTEWLSKLLTPVLEQYGNLS